MPTRILLLRHAQSADPSVFHGAESDIGLSPLGGRQAELAAVYLASLRPDAVVSSGMRRAIDTATPIALACGKALGLEPDLHERRVGPMSGMIAQQTHDGPWPTTLRRWLAGETGYAPEGAESFDAIRDRVLPVWHRLAERHAGRTVVVVAHGVVCKVLLLSLLPGLGIADWTEMGPIHNVAIHELTRQDGGAWHAERVNDLPYDVNEPGA
jgi:2,3-bisphosphoglycerate-dependent phosphoglycerate mutase